MKRSTRRRRARTSSQRSYLTGVALATLAAVAAVASIAVGVVAWSMERPERVPVSANAAAALERTPWFDSGVTLFATPIGSERDPQPPPAAWACTLSESGLTQELVRRPDRDRVGTRVVEGVSVVPVVTVGRTSARSELLCTGEAARNAAAMWVLPANPGVPRTPLSLVVGGIALAGLATAVHPRGRGLRPFGR